MHASPRALAVACHALGLTALALVGCGALAGEPEQPTRLTEVQGNTGALAKLAPKRPHVTLVWRTRDATALVALDDLALPTPGAFRLDVRNPPPIAATHTVVLNAEDPSALSFAIGALVAYDDLDGDGRLSLQPGRLTTSSDQLLAANPLFYVVWLYRQPSLVEAARLADGAGRTPTAGLNFLRVTATGSRWVSSAEPYELGTPETVALPDQVCSALYDDPTPDVGPTRYDLQRTFPAPGAVGLTCEDRGRSLTFQACAPEGLCAGAPSCKRDTRRLETGEAPTGWPCRLE